MLRDDDEVDWVRYQQTKSYSDPGRRARSNRLALTLRMWEAGMLSFVDEVKEHAGVFTVVKSLEEGSMTDVKASRLAWDCRRLNLRFRRLPWTGLGSPSALSSLDLSPE
eukprot:3566482-Pyramimonas_sp.AAC.1